ncbi:MAG: alanine--tRNA ligase [Candidatus Pacebacteria bacterium]|nr:alanine--tRNA ligase [Candidatus Paceibacterota bacterium]
MQSSEIRKRFLAFFEKRGHAIVPSAPLVPQNDPTTLFTGSGMQPMIPYLLGEKHPLGTRIADSQKSFRSGDIEEVGDNRHTTFFEMLGNWSLGDYFKKEQLSWIFEFLVDEIALDPNKLFVTVFSGHERYGFPRDDESVTIWKELFAAKGIDAQDVLIGSEANGYEVGMSGGRIFYYDAKKNWWSRAGIPENMPAGEPGGPDSEIFYDFGTPHDPAFGKECHPNCDCGRFLEIGNSVFMQYLKQADDSFVPLAQKNVDFGGGLERIAMASTSNSDIIAINHHSIIDFLEKASGKKYGEEKEETRAFRIIADHAKAAVFLIADGVRPSNTDQGYFVRRLLRRAIRYWDKLGIADEGLSQLVDPIAAFYQESYPELTSKKVEIAEEIKKEEGRFRQTLERGLKEFEKIPVGPISATQASTLYQSYGFPFELIEELAKEKGSTVSRADFDEEMKKHQELSRAGSEQKFKGGLGDTSEMSLRYHTATHLLNAALKRVLGEHVKQRGSNITPERLRFDFSHPTKMTDEEKQKVEILMNEWISEGLTVMRREMPRGEAEKMGAEMEFGAKYPDIVSVYSIEDIDGTPISQEFCGGPHVENTKVLGTFKIAKEEASSAGVRRIKATLS